MPNKDINKSRETQRRYRERHKEERNRANREWYAKNSEKMCIHMSEYRKTHKELVNKANRQWGKKTRESYRHLVTQGYGGKCICCGETEELFMQIHHPNGDGKSDREMRGGNTQTLFKWLIANNFPDNYQLLCANCHLGIHRSEDKKCPHKKQ